jgi:hypothetical protein
MQEAWSYLGTRAAGADFPFPSCMCPKDELTNLSCVHPLRTTETMRAAYEASKGLGITAKADHLQSFGIHDTEVLTGVRSSLVTKMTDFPAVVRVGLSLLQPVQELSLRRMSLRRPGMLGQASVEASSRYLDDAWAQISFKRDVRGVSSITTLD